MIGGERAQASDWRTLVEHYPSYAHCLLFASPEQRERFSVLLLLCLELEKALASDEVMIRLIRVKWWEEALLEATPTPSHPLVPRILHFKQQSMVNSSELDTLIEGWQLAAENKQALESAWRRTFCVLVSAPRYKKSANRIGSQIFHSRTRNPVTPLSADERLALRQLGTLGIVLQGFSFQAFRVDAKKDLHPDDDPLFIFRLFWHLLRGWHLSLGNMSKAFRQ